MAVRHAWLDQEHKNSVFILRDVSESKKLEREREEMRRQQALVEMSALLAHEIRNPLGSLELFAGLLAEADLDGDCRQWVEHVQAGLRTLAATTNNVLHLHNTPAPELAEFDAGELLDWSFAFLRPLAKQAQVSLQVLNCLRGVQVRGDRHRLEQVILNARKTCCCRFPRRSPSNSSSSTSLSSRSPRRSASPVSSARR